MLNISRCLGNALYMQAQIGKFSYTKMVECAKSLMNFSKNYKVFWMARTLKTQIFKKLKEIFCASRYENKQRSGYFAF